MDAVEYDGYPDAEPLLSLEEETWRQVTLGAGSAAPNTSGEASDGEKSDGEAGDALPSSATDVGGAVAAGGEVILMCHELWYIGMCMCDN